MLRPGARLRERDESDEEYSRRATAKKRTAADAAGPSIPFASDPAGPPTLLSHLALPPDSRKVFLSAYRAPVPVSVSGAAATASLSASGTSAKWLSDAELDAAYGAVSEYMAAIAEGRRRGWKDEPDPEELAAAAAAAAARQEAKSEEKRRRQAQQKLDMYKAMLARKRRKCEECGKTHPPLLLCFDCVRSYHGDCLQLPAATAERIYEKQEKGEEQWRCVNCKICETCHDPGNERSLLFCDECDKGYHTFCLQPPLKTAPVGRWVCKQCVKCEKCGARTPGTTASARWRGDYRLCETCHRLAALGQYCPVCKVLYRQTDKAPMVCCDRCSRWVHIECDNISPAAYEELSRTEKSYICPECRALPPKQTPVQAKSSGERIAAAMGR